MPFGQAPASAIVCCLLPPRWRHSLELVYGAARRSRCVNRVLCLTCWKSLLLVNAPRRIALSLLCFAQTQRKSHQSYYFEAKSRVFEVDSIMQKSFQRPFQIQSPITFNRFQKKDKTLKSKNRRLRLVIKESLFTMFLS